MSHMESTGATPAAAERWRGGERDAECGGIAAAQLAPAFSRQGIDEAMRAFAQRQEAALCGSLRDFEQIRARHPQLRADRFHAWMRARDEMGCFPYAKALTSAPLPRATVKLGDGVCLAGLNFSSQDYLNLATEPSVIEAAAEAMLRYGVHSAGSSALAGNTTEGEALEQALAELLHKEHVLLFPTGWAAGYGAIRGLVRATDHVVLDQLSHNCLQEGAAAATRNVHRHRHLDLDHLRRVLARVRERDAENGIVVVTEGVFSMDSDSPDLPATQRLAAEFDAMLLVDVAHDLGCLGPGGSGQLGQQDMLDHADLVIGSFSKSFASNGGFVATQSRAIKEYLRYGAAPNTFSNAMSPIQVAVVTQSLRIIRSQDGEARRRRLMQGVRVLRESLEERGLTVLGKPSPIVPVMLGEADIGRLAAREMLRCGLLANLVEYPAVANNATRLRMQVMADHSPQQCTEAADFVAHAVRHARLVRQHMVR